MRDKFQLSLLICTDFNKICIKTGVEKMSLLLYNLYCRYRKGCIYVIIINFLRRVLL